MNGKQSIEHTKSEILQTINSVEANLRLSKVSIVKTGELVIRCQMQEENEKFL